MWEAFSEEVSPQLSVRPSRFSEEEKASHVQEKACLGSIKGRGVRKHGERGWAWEGENARQVGKLG